LLIVGEAIGWIWAIAQTIGMGIEIGQDGMTNEILIGMPITIVIGIMPGVVIVFLCRKYRNEPNATTTHPYGGQVNTDSEKNPPTPPEPSIKSTPKPTKNKRPMDFF